MIIPIEVAGFHAGFHGASTVSYFRERAARELSLFPAERREEARRRTEPERAARRPARRRC